MKQINGFTGLQSATPAVHTSQGQNNASIKPALYQPGVFGPAFQKLNADLGTERKSTQMSNIIASLISAITSQPGTTVGGKAATGYGQVAAGLAKINAGASSTQQPNLKALFPGVPTPVVPQKAVPTAPTAESVFGSNPWMSNPTGIGPNGKSYSYNKFYFATKATAEKVAKMAGGTVVKTNMFTPSGGAFSQQQPNYMVQMPDGRMINPGLVASFYTHGYPQSYVDQMVAAEFRG